MIVIFLGAVAFSVDIGYMQLSRTQLKIATDAAARAGGEALTRVQDLPTAVQAAKDMAAANLVAGEPLILADEDLITGNSAQQADGTWVFTENGTPTNSIRVSGRRTSDSPSGTVSLFFGSVFDVYDFEPTKVSTVVRTDRDICLVVDRSSSMKLDLATTSETMSTGDPRFCEVPDAVDSRWAALADAVQVFTDTLASTPQTEHVSLVSYASDYTNCGVTNNASDIDQDLASDHTQVNQAMASISSTVFNGATNIAAGIDDGVVALTDPTTARPFATKTMIVFTDGHRTAGRQPDLAAQDASLENIVIHTVTFGNGANQLDMQAVADATGGNHYHAPDAQALEDVFREIAMTISVTFTD
jgi:hypothetical protein